MKDFVTSPIDIITEDVLDLIYPLRIKRLLDNALYPFPNAIVCTGGIKAAGGLDITIKTPIVTLWLELTRLKNPENCWRLPSPLPTAYSIVNFVNRLLDEARGFICSCHLADLTRMETARRGDIQFEVVHFDYRVYDDMIHMCLNSNIPLPVIPKSRTIDIVLETTQPDFATDVCTETLPTTAMLTKQPLGFFTLWAERTPQYALLCNATGAVIASGKHAETHYE